MNDDYHAAASSSFSSPLSSTLSSSSSLLSSPFESTTTYSSSSPASTPDVLTLRRMAAAIVPTLHTSATTSTAATTTTTAATTTTTTAATVAAAAVSHTLGSNANIINDRSNTGIQNFIFNNHSLIINNNSISDTPNPIASPINLSSGNSQTIGYTLFDFVRIALQNINNSYHKNNTTTTSITNNTATTTTTTTATIWSSTNIINTTIHNATTNVTDLLPVGITGGLNGRTQKWGMLALIAVILCTAIGNLLVCLAVCSERRLQNMTNYFLMSLAIADFLVSILVMPLGMIVSIYGIFPLHPEFCVFWVTSDVLMCTASIWHMCTMSMDRFFTLKYPMRYGRNKTRRMVIGKILFVWIVSLAISCPIGIMGFIDNTAVFNHGVCVPTVENFLFYASIFAFYIPLFIMLVTYVLTIRILWKNQKRMKSIERSELKPKLAQLTAQCTGFAVPKLLNNIRKQQKQVKRNGSLRSGGRNNCPSPLDRNNSFSTDERTALSSSCYDPCEGEGHHGAENPKPKVVPSQVTSKGMTYLPVPTPQPHSALSSRSASPLSTSSCNYYLSSEEEELESEEEKAKYVTLLKSSPSFRSLCAPGTTKITSKPSSRDKDKQRRQRKLSYKERHKRLQQQQQQQQQLTCQNDHINHTSKHKNKTHSNSSKNNIIIKSDDNFKRLMTPLISVYSGGGEETSTGKPNSKNLKKSLRLSSSTNDARELRVLPNPLLNISSSSTSNSNTSNSNSNTKAGCESLKGVEALVNTFSILSTPLQIRWDSSRQISCPSTPSDVGYPLNPSHQSLSLPRLSSPNNSTTDSTNLLLSSSVSQRVASALPPELKIQLPSTDSSSVSQLDVSRNSNNISTNSCNLNFNQSDVWNGVTSSRNGKGTSSPNASLSENPSQLEVPGPGYYRKYSVTRTSSGPILGGAVSDSNVCQTGLSAKTGEPNRRGLGSFPLSCGNLSKDYKSEEWDRRYFQIQEEMDELLRESFDRKATSEQGEDIDLNASPPSPDSPLTTPKSVDYLTTGTGNKQAACFFRCHSMPNSPEKIKRSRKRIILKKDDVESSSSENDGDDDASESGDEDGGDISDDAFEQEEQVNDDAASTLDCDESDSNIAVDDSNSIESGKVFTSASLFSKYDNYNNTIEDSVDVDDLINKTKTDLFLAPCDGGECFDNEILINRADDRVEEKDVNDVIKICLHPPTSDVSELESSDCNDFLNSSIKESNTNSTSYNDPFNVSGCGVDNLKAWGNNCNSNDKDSSYCSPCPSQFSSSFSINNINTCNNESQNCSRRVSQDSNNRLLQTSLVMSPSASSQNDQNLISEADMTLDETDDTLDGDTSQCRPSEDFTETLEEDDQRASGEEMTSCKQTYWGRFKKWSPRGSKSKRKYSKKSSSSGKDNNYQQSTNSFRMKRMSRSNDQQTGADDSPFESEDPSDVSGPYHHRETQKRTQNHHHHNHNHHNHHHHHHHNNNNNHKSSSKPRQLVLSKKTASNEKKASKVLGIIFLVFVLLWTPFFLVNIMTSICPNCVMIITEDLMSLIVWMGWIASLANPIIYTMFNTAFRRTFVHILTCKLDTLHCVLFSSSRRRRDVRMRRKIVRGRRDGLRGVGAPSYNSTVVASDRRNTVTLVLRDESR